MAGEGGGILDNENHVFNTHLFNINRHEYQISPAYEVYLFIYLFVHSFIHSFIHLFILGCSHIQVAFVLP